MIRTYNVLRLLARDYDITALCFFRRATHPNEQFVRAAVDGLSQFGQIEAFPIPQEWNRARLLLDHARSVATGRPYTVYAYESRSFRARLAQLLREHSFDLVHMDSLDLSAYLPALAGRRVVCGHHNAEAALLQRRAAVEKSRPLRAYLRFQSRLMAAEERTWCPRVQLNVLVSEADQSLLSRAVPGIRTLVIPNGVDTRLLKPGPSGHAGLVFVGGYTWYPNRDALEYFCDAILPLIRSELPSLPVTWVGRAPDDVREKYRTKHGVTLTGYVTDIAPVVQAAACYVVPLRIGGGTRLKILDAWALGMAVVSTSIGCEGLAAEDGQNILVRDDARSFARAVTHVIRNPELRSRIARGARATAVTTYDWEVIAGTMLPAYAKLIASA